MVGVMFLLTTLRRVWRELTGYSVFLIVSFSGPMFPRSWIFSQDLLSSWLKFAIMKGLASHSGRRDRGQTHFIPSEALASGGTWELLSQR